jgi:hypothetical protein
MGKNAQRRRDRRDGDKARRRIYGGTLHFAHNSMSALRSQRFQWERMVRAYWVVKNGQEHTKLVPNREQRRGNPTGRGGHR